jgi:ankyrin repeat protein
MTDDQKPALFSPGLGQLGMNELHDAAYCGDEKALLHALASGLDPNVRDNYRGYTPLHWVADMAAAGGPRLSMAAHLLDRGAEINVQSNDGLTALDLAREAGNATGDELVLYLVSRGANENDV